MIQKIIAVLKNNIAHLAFTEMKRCEDKNVLISGTRYIRKKMSVSNGKLHNSLSIRHRMNNGHFVRITDTAVNVIWNLGKDIYLFKMKNIRVHEKIQISELMLMKPHLHMRSQVRITCTVQQETIEVDHPVLHIALAGFGENTLNDVLTSVRRTF